MTTEVTNIWTDFHKELKAFIRNKTRNSADTDDILQEVFIKIIRNIDKVNQAEICDIICTESYEIQSMIILKTESK